MAQKYETVDVAKSPVMYAFDKVFGEKGERGWIPGLAAGTGIALSGLLTTATPANVAIGAGIGLAGGILGLRKYLRGDAPTTDQSDETKVLLSPLDLIIDGALGIRGLRSVPVGALVGVGLGVMSGLPAMEIAKQAVFLGSALGVASTKYFVGELPKSKI